MDVSAPRKGRGEIASAWGADAEQLLQDWRNRAYAAQSAYYLMAERYRRWNFLLGIPVVILSGLVGTAIFADLQNSLSYGQVRVTTLAF